MYKYHRPDASIDVRFEFRKVRTGKGKHTGKPNAIASHDGVVQVLMKIGNIHYGPYATPIKTFRSIWDGRIMQRMGADSRALANELMAYQARVESVHDKLLKIESPIDGELIMNTLKGGDTIGQLVTLTRVYEEFIKARADMVAEQEQRSCDQIAESTFRSYPKRWEMIQIYLVHIERVQMPVGAIAYSFATDLKEWLNKQSQSGGKRYAPVTVNKAISFLKQQMTYALSKGYVSFNPVRDFACRGGSVPNPKPLTKEQLDDLETCPLPFRLRHICDSWLVAGELCLHYSDYMKLPKVKFIEKNGMRFIQHTRSKQQGSSLKQTVNVTDRAMRLIEKYGGVKGLYYRHSSVFSKALKEIAEEADLRDEDGKLIGLQFGQGRDSGLTQRAIDGANGIQLSKIAGWSKPVYAERYIGNPINIVGEFVKSSKSGKDEVKPTMEKPFIQVHRAS